MPWCASNGTREEYRIMTETATAETGSVTQAAFAFVQSLASELAAGKIELPSFPSIALRVRKVLADENVRPEQVVRVVGSEPALAARVLQLANSAALNIGGKQIVDLKTAIARVGFNMVRSAAISFAMSQLKKAAEFKNIERELDTLWRRNVLVASMSYVVARRCTQVNADTAMLAGLLHGVGKLYILTRATRHPALFTDKAAYNEILRDWHANVAKALLENWEIAPEIVDAVHGFEDLDRSHEGATDLTDVLTVAELLVSYHKFPESLELNMQGCKACLRMRVEPQGWTRILEESAAEMEQLRAALGQ
jgi:HD-like signal output (HDOD) protein